MPQSPEKPRANDDLVKQAYKIGYEVGYNKSPEFSAILERNKLLKEAEEENTRSKIHDAYIAGKKKGRKKRTAELLNVVEPEDEEKTPETQLLRESMEKEDSAEISAKSRPSPDVTPKPENLVEPGGSTVEPKKDSEDRPIRVVKRDRPPGGPICEAYIVRGLFRIIFNHLGRDRAETIAYETGMQAGVRAGEKRLGRTYQPNEAIETLLHDAQCYDVDVLEEKKEGGSTEVMIRFNRCVIRDILGAGYEKNPRLRNMLCTLTRGYVEGALSIMTGKRVEEHVSSSAVDPDSCTGVIRFSRTTSKT